MSLKDYLVTSPQFILPKTLTTTLAGCLANVEASWIKNPLINAFIWKFGVNMQEAEFALAKEYKSFNEFFIRSLKPHARKLEDSPLISPVDGCVSELGRIRQGQVFQAKGKYYSAHQLLACTKEEAEVFGEGHFATLYLSPKDYHRVHMPIAGHLEKMVYVPGRLFSVQPATVNCISNLFALNERLVLHFSTEKGPMALVMVGATIVGAMGTSWQGDITRQKHQQTTLYGVNHSISLNQGDEVGYFKLGSTVILLLTEESGISWKKELGAGSSIKMGEALIS